MKSIVKLLIPLFIVFLIQSESYASDFGLKLQIEGGTRYPTDGSLRGYYGRDVILSYGPTGVVTYTPLAAGMFVRYQGYSFVVKDEVLSSEQRMKGSWIVLGIQKDFPIGLSNLFIRFGLSIHQDDLEFADTEDSRIGTFYSLGFEYGLSGHFSVFLESAYVHERLEIPDYKTFMYSRHQAFLAGEKLQTGGVLLHAGLSYSINSEK